MSEELIAAGAWSAGSDRHRHYNDAPGRELAAAAANLECEPGLRDVEDQVVAEGQAGLLMR